MTARSNRTGRGQGASFGYRSLHYYRPGTLLAVARRHEAAGSLLKACGEDARSRACSDEDWIHRCGDGDDGSQNCRGMGWGTSFGYRSFHYRRPGTLLAVTRRHEAAGSLLKACREDARSRACSDEDWIQWCGDDDDGSQYCRGMGWGTSFGCRSFHYRRPGTFLGRDPVA